MNMENVATVTDTLEDQIRESIDTFVVSSKGGNADAKLHIPNGNGPLCKTKTREKEWTTKSTAVYPKGHKDICQYCATEFKHE